MPSVVGSLLAETQPAALLPARWQMALSLGFHIVYACFGVAFPALIYVVHRRGLRDGDPVALGLAKRWGKVAAVLFAVGAVSGTILSFEMGLLWPELMRTYGDVIGLPFTLEGIAFFLEAIFIGIYLYGWGRLPDRVHLAILVPIMASGLIGTHMIMSVNAWMNAPAGFDVVVTPDQNLPHQQNLSAFDISVVVLASGLNRMATYEPLAERLREAVVAAQRGSALIFTA
jgi:cytochrome bd-type quinol oxidase subunit 1